MADSIKDGKITEKLKAYGRGDVNALNEILPLIHDELLRRARYHLNHERPNHTLQTAALVNEAYLRLIDQHSANLNDREHFFAIASTVMRRVLVNYAKERNRLKRGGKEENLPLDEALRVSVDEADVDVLDLNEALDRLAEMDKQQAKIVDLRFFGGLTIEKTAEVLRIAPATVKRDWKMAKSWLYSELNKNK